MTDVTPPERVLDFVDRYLAFLTDGGEEPDLEALEEPLRSQALQQLRVLDLLDLLGEPESYPMPPIEDDPIAKRFGFDRADPTVTISVAALKDAAVTANLRFSDLAAKLTAGGRQTEGKDLFRLSNGVTAEVDRDLAARLAAILETSVPDLEAPHRDATTISLDEFLVLEETRQVVDSFARELAVPYDETHDRAREILAGTAFRNRTDDAWRDALRAALETIRRERRR